MSDMGGSLLSDELDQSQEPAGTSEQPSGTGASLDLEAIVSKLEERLNPRFTSLLTSVDGKMKKLDNSFSSKLAELKTAGLSEAEQEQLAERQRDADFQRLQIENQLFRLRDTHPRAVDLILKMRDPDISSLDEQVAAVEAFIASTSAPASSATPETPEAEAGAASEVDRNNPARQTPSALQKVLDNPEDMTDEMAEEILKLGSPGVLMQDR